MSRPTEGEQSQWDHAAASDDELLDDRIPTVAATVAATDPAEVRKALLVLYAQAVDAGADPDELIDALRAVNPTSWGTALNKNRLYNR